MELLLCSLKQCSNEGFTYTATAEGIRHIEAAQAAGQPIRDIGVDVQAANPQKSSVVSDREQTFTRLIEPVASVLPLANQTADKVEPLIDSFTLKIQ